MDNQAHKKYSGLSIASLVLGVVSIIPVWGFIAAILAIVFGAVSKKQIKDGILQGSGFATAGITLGIIILTIYILLIGWGIIMSFTK